MPRGKLACQQRAGHPVQFGLTMTTTESSTSLFAGLWTLTSPKTSSAATARPATATTVFREFTTLCQAGCFTTMATVRLPTSAANLGSRSASARLGKEHTSELQSQSNLVCRLLLEKKNKNKDYM